MKYWETLKRILTVALSALLIVSVASPAKAFGEVRRIVSLAPSVTESLFALGFGNLVVGVTDYDVYPEETRSIPSVGGYYDPSLEKVLALEPDLVVGIGTFHSGFMDRIEGLGISTLALVVHRRFEDIRGALETISERLGQPAEAERLWREITGHMEATEKRVRHEFEDGPPSVMVIVWHDPLTVAGGYNYIDDILKMIGIPNAAGDIRYTFPVINREGLIVRNPGVLIVATASKGMTFSAEDLKSVIADLPIEAVEKERIVEVSADLLFHPGPRAADAAAVLLDAVVSASEGGEATFAETKVFH